MSVAVEPKPPDDLPALEAALRSISENDPQLSLHINHESNHLTLNGMSELQLDVAIARERLNLLRQAPLHDLADAPYFVANHGGFLAIASLGGDNCKAIVETRAA